MSEPSTMDMSTEDLAARVRQGLLANTKWSDSGPEFDCFIDELAADVVAAVTGDRPPTEAESLPEPVHLRTVPIEPVTSGRITTYRRLVEVQSQWIEVAAYVASACARPAEVVCDRRGSQLHVRIVADDGTVYAWQVRRLDGVW